MDLPERSKSQNLAEQLYKLNFKYLSLFLHIKSKNGNWILKNKNFFIFYLNYIKTLGNNGIYLQNMAFV